MPFVHSTLPAQHDKPAKPYAEFPLFAHAAGVWAKKIHGFLNAKQALVAEGRLSSLTRNDHKTACDEISAAFGKARLVEDLRPDDSEDLRKRMAKNWGLQRLCKTIQFVRCAFRYAYDRPLRFGPGFTRPSKKDFRLHQAKQGPKLFTREEVTKLLGHPRCPFHKSASTSV